MYSLYGEDKEHMNIADSLFKVGHLLEAQGKMCEAETLLRKDLDMRCSIHGQN